MQTYFNNISNHISSSLYKNEIYKAWYSGEKSSFVRFNKASIRQPGNVTQHTIDLELILGLKHVGMSLGLSGDLTTDYDRLSSSIKKLRDQLTVVPDDPLLLYAESVSSSASVKKSELASDKEIVFDILDEVRGLDFVGILASGAIMRGFSNSFGQRNWLESHSMNLDFSCYHSGDKAVKTSYAAPVWDKAAFNKKIQGCKSQLEILNLPSRSVTPGRYRAFFSPQALSELLETMCFGGFSLKAMKTKHSPLLLMQEEGVGLNPQLTIFENIRDGFAPAFQEDGFIKKDVLTLIEGGKIKDLLISPRTAKEFSLITNGANGNESPCSIDIKAGQLDADNILSELSTGIYINNLWYLNYSDCAKGRVTGMTRFATFWVENGKIVAPLNVMRFDDSLFRMLGSNLLGLTTQRELIMDSSTYEERSVKSARLPGALISDLSLTL